MNPPAILKFLDRSDAVDWHPDFNEAKTAAYEFIVSSLEERDLTEYQRANAIRCLFRLRFHVTEERAFADLCRYCRSESLRERSVAVRLATALVGLLDACPIPSRSFTPSQKDLLIIQEGLNMGVDEITSKQAAEILKNRM